MKTQGLFDFDASQFLGRLAEYAQSMPGAAENAVNADIAALVPERVAKKYTCIPVRLENERLVLAMANPMDLLAIEDIGLITQKSVDVRVAPHSAVEAAINRYYWEPE